MNFKNNFYETLLIDESMDFNDDIERITTKELGELLEKCDKYLKLNSNESVFTIIETVNENSADIIMQLLLAQPNTLTQEVFNLHSEIMYELIQHEESFYNFLHELSNKKILNISDATLLLSSLTPESLTTNIYEGEIELSKDSFGQNNKLFASTKYKEEDLKKILDALKNNMQLFEKLYKDKVLVVNTTDVNDPHRKTHEKIEISSERFFHLIGFEWRNLKINTPGFDELSKVFDYSEMSRLKDNLSSRKSSGGLFEVLQSMVKHEEIFIEALLEGKLRKAINIPKLEMKNYGFERIGLLEHSSGLIKFDKNIAEGNTVSRHIKSDLILLNAFIRRYDLSAAFTLYYNYQPQIRDSESLIVPRAGLEKSAFFKGQSASVADSVASFNKRDFDFSISSEDSNSAYY